MGKSVVKKGLKIAAWILGVFLALDLLLVGLLFVPAIQTFVVHKVTESLSEAWGTEISIGDIRITPTLKLVAHEVAIKDHHNENMIYSGTVKGRLRGIQTKPFKLRLGDVEFDNLDVVLRTYSGEDLVNIAKWALVFKKKEPNKQPFELTSNSVDITHGRFVLINDDKRKVFDTTGHPNIDYAFFELANLNVQAKDFHLIGADISMKFNQLAFNQYGGFRLDHCSGDFRICDTTLVFNNLKLKTQQSDLDLDLYFRYERWKTYAAFVDSVRIGAEIRPSVLSMDDVAGFAPAIRGMREIFHLQADTVDGTVSDFRTQNLKARWLDRNFVQGNFAIRDVIHFLNADFDVSMDSTVFHLPDLAEFTLPKGKTIKTNKLLNTIGTTTLSGTIQGDLDNLKANLSASTALGSVKAKLSSETYDGKLHLNGDVSSSNLNMAKLVGDRQTFGSCQLRAKFDGSTSSTGFTADNLKTLRAHIDGQIQRFPLFGYPLRDIHVTGDYREGLYTADLQANDPNLQCNVIAQLDMSQRIPFLQGSIDLPEFAAGNIGTALPKVDSASATGIYKFISILQRNPELNLSFDHFQIAVHGTGLDDCNGYIGCDNIKLTLQEGNLSNERLRLTAINNNDHHKYILASNIVNATYESTYPIATIKDSLRTIIHNFLPSLIGEMETAQNTYDNEIASDRNGYIKLNVRTYSTRPITRLFFPDLFIAPGSTVDLDIRSNHVDDRVEIDLPFFAIRSMFRLHHFHLNGQTTDPTILGLNVRGDSVIVYAGQNTLHFNKVGIQADVANDDVTYSLRWHNPFNSENNISNLSGTANISHLDNIVVQLDKSQIYLKDYECHFNDQNVIRIKPHTYEIENLQFYAKEGSIDVNGSYDTKDSSRLHMAAKNVDISLVNTLLNGMTFGGQLFADLNLVHRNNRNLLFGKIITDELNMNEVRLGDLFLVAGLNNEKAVRFVGGLFNNSSETLNYDYLSNFTFRDFQNENNIVAHVNGSYENKNFLVKADFDSLQAGFLEPFLSSFCDQFSGIASGNLAFHVNPDSAYLDGNVHVIDALMGIAALGTLYHVVDQDIKFTPEGIVFPNMRIMDKDENIGVLTGEIKHKLFKNMQLHLDIHTDRILALNTPHKPTSMFYGTGYVKGDVSITGTGNNLAFKGDNIETLNGSKIYLQVNSVNSASETDFIHFVPKKSEEELVMEDQPKSSTNLNFDFTFHVTNDADIVLLLESIGGTLNARADGRFQLLYNSNTNLNLFGNLMLHSGDFKIALFDVVNSKYKLVQGGSINFDGPLENMTVNLSAYKTSKTSLANIIPADYGLVTSNTDVNSYIYLNGPLMRKIEPTFGFELPNSSSEVQDIFYGAIDTQNRENMTKQFAYFLVTNSFMPENMFSNSSNAAAPGVSMLSNFVNTMISNAIDSKHGGFGITYNPATEGSSAEYGLRANANLLNERILMSTSFGYYDDRAVSNAYRNLYGNISVEYLINPSGTWRVKAYTRIGERDDLFYALDNNYSNYVAGGALIYKQDFDSRSRNRNKTKKSKNTKKSTDQDK